MAKEGVLIYYDRTSDPSTNLAREEEIFQRVERRELPELVRLWVDSECLVRGRAKSARYGWYHEALARKMGVRVVERGTGGGVVYHDEGNLNWSFFLHNSGPLLSPAEMFENASAYMVRALAGLGVDAEFAPPNRIDVHGHKVSGMAARTTPRTRLVHGTLLLDTDLEKLNLLCIPPKGCPPVANINEWTEGVGPAEIVKALVRALEVSGIRVRTTDAIRRIRTGPYDDSGFLANP